MCRRLRRVAGQVRVGSPEERFSLSGAAVREMLVKGQRPPVEFTRPVIADILIESMKTES